MKFIATLILNAIVTLGLIAFCFNYLLKPYIESEMELMQTVIGQKANYAHFVGIDEKVDKLNAELNEHKKLTNTRTGALVQRISKLENSNSLSPTIGFQMKALENAFVDLSTKIEKLEKLLPKFQKTKPNASLEQ